MSADDGDNQDEHADSASLGANPEHLSHLQQMHALPSLADKTSRQDILLATLEGLRPTLDTLSIRVEPPADLGMVRAQVMHAMGLGFPPKSYWTRRSVEWIITQALGLFVTREQMSSKRRATATLEDYLSKQGGVAPEDSSKRKQVSSLLQVGGDSNTVGGAWCSQDEGRSGLMKLLYNSSRDNEDPDVSLVGECASLGKSWRGGHEESSAHTRAALFQQVNGVLALGTEECDWQKLVNFSNTHEYLPLDYPQESLRGIHWVTAAAKLMQTVSVINARDETGYATAASTTGNHELAMEWIGQMWAAAVKLLPNGGVVSEMPISKVSIRGLQGMGSAPPRPSTPDSHNHAAHESGRSKPREATFPNRKHSRRPEGEFHLAIDDRRCSSAESHRRSSKGSSSRRSTADRGNSCAKRSVKQRYNPARETESCD